LVQAGRLSWDQPLISLLPEIRFADPVATERATVADALLHRTGLISGNWTWHDAPSDPAELMRRMPHIPCRPGYRAGFHYQNLHFTILGEVFKALGTDWHQAMREMLGLLSVKPLTRLAEFAASERALGYGPSGLVPPQRTEDFDFEGAAAASAVCGDIQGLAQVARMMALGGTVDGHEVVSPAIWKELTRPVLAQGDSEWPELRQKCSLFAGASAIYRGEKLLIWAGGFVGYTAHVAVLPEKRAAACAMANRSSSTASDLLAMALLDRAVGWEPLPWADRYLKQKRRMRSEGQRRLAEKQGIPGLPWPFPSQAACGRFEHPGYGLLEVVDSGQGPYLHFRQAALPLTPRAEEVMSAEGTSRDCPEIFWNLRPLFQGGKVKAWDFCPDDPLSHCPFERVDG
jgi:hypothetical protein